MHFSTDIPDRALYLRAAALRLKIPERTLRYRASRGKVPGAFRQGKLWRFSAAGLEQAKEAGRVS